jgi:hypothetical protein
MFDHLRQSGMLPPGQPVDYLVTESVEDILPTLLAAAVRISESEKQGVPERVRRM